MYHKSLKAKLSDTVRVPKDVSMGLPLIRVVGQSEIYIENYRGILEYTDSNIRIQTKIGQIHIEGMRMEISYYSNDEMKIEGYLTEIKLCQGG